jgi:hypothetical protein
VASITKAEAAERLGDVANELEDLRRSLEFPVGAHLPITPAVLERLDAATAAIREVGDAEIADDAAAELEPDAASEAGPGEVVELREPATGTAGASTEPPAPPAAAGPPVSEAQRAALAAAGFETGEQIRNATDDQLLAVDGIGPATVEKLREATRE